MNSFQANSYQLVETKKWAPAGMLFMSGAGTIKIQESEFSPEHRFDTKEEADNFFRKHYLAKGFTEKRV